MADPAHKLPPFDIPKFEAALQKQEEGVFSLASVDLGPESSAAGQLKLGISHLISLGAGDDPLGPAYVVYKILVDHVVGWGSRFGSSDAYDVAIEHWVRLLRA
jgi:hypothetical protein